MANRSDFFNTSVKTPKLPRYLKKILILNFTDPHYDGEVRRLFIQAHSNHVSFKLKREHVDTIENTDEPTTVVVA
jgi:hypothetical protein